MKHIDYSRPGADQAVRDAHAAVDAAAEVSPPLATPLARALDAVLRATQRVGAQGDGGSSATTYALLGKARASLIRQAVESGDEAALRLLPADEREQARKKGGPAAAQDGGPEPLSTAHAAIRTAAAAAARRGG